MSSKRTISGVLALIADIRKFPRHGNVSLSRETETLNTITGLPTPYANEECWSHITLPRAYDMLMGYIACLRVVDVPTSDLTFGTKSAGAELI